MTPRLVSRDGKRLRYEVDLPVGRWTRAYTYEARPGRGGNVTVERVGLGTAVTVYPPGAPRGCSCPDGRGRCPHQTVAAAYRAAQEEAPRG